MQNDEQQTKQSHRDYDKEPIVIKDYNMFFDDIHLIIYIILGATAVALSWEKVDYYNLIMYGVVLGSIYVYPSIYQHFKQVGKTFIHLRDSEIIFELDGHIAEKIKLEEIDNLYKTNVDYHHKSQNTNNFSILSRLLRFLFSVIDYPLMVLYKVIFRLKQDGFKHFRFDDAVIVFSQDKLINILPNNNDEYELVRRYFIDKLDKDIENLKIYNRYIKNTSEIDIKNLERMNYDK
jgi:hypothetical protein